MNFTNIRILIVAIALGSMTACGGGGSGGSPPPPPPEPPVAGFVGDGRLPELLEWARATQDVPAMAMVLVRNGQIAEMGAVGRRSALADTPVTLNDKWHIGSLTKAITSTLAGVMVDQSLISWDTTTLEVWPELNQQIHPSFRNTTLRELLSHTSGMRRVNEAPSAYLDNRPGTAMEKRRLWAADLLGEAPTGPAGQSSYSNGGYVVAGAMLETITGTPWETLLEQQVFGPLGMRDSGFGAPGTPNRTDEPWGHWDRGSSFEAVSPGAGADNPQAMGPAGTVHVTLSDYAQFMTAHINGARGIPGLVTARTFATLHTPVDDGSALGWGVDSNNPDAGGVVLGHGGSNLRWFALVTLAPNSDVGVFMVVNAAGNEADAALDALGDLIEERLDASR